MMKKIAVFLSVLVMLAFVSCNPEEPTIPSETVVGKGVFVLNEGTYTFANASLSFYDPVADTVANNLFYKVNGAPVGDVAQSLAMIGDYLYIVVNNSNYIYKVNAHTLKCDTTQPYKLDQFYSPRYILPLSATKAYVTDLVGNEIWIINPQDMSHTGTIAMGKPTETMVMVGNEVYVSNWSNYYNNAVNNNTVMVVDAYNDMKVAEIEVGKEPNGMAVDKDGYVWVLCEGAYWDADAEEPSLWKINPMTKQATCERTFADVAMNLAIDTQGQYLYCFVDGDVRRISVTAPSDEDDFRIASEGRNFYKLFVHPVSGDIYVTDAKNYLTNGTVYRYSFDGVQLGSFNVGICPGFMLFN